MKISIEVSNKCLEVDGTDTPIILKNKFESQGIFEMWDVMTVSGDLNTWYTELFYRDKDRYYIVLCGIYRFVYELSSKKLLNVGFNRASIKHGDMCEILVDDIKVDVKSMLSQMIILDTNTIRYNKVNFELENHWINIDIEEDK